MTPTEIAAWVGAAAGLGGVGTAVALVLKARPEGRRINADAAQVIQDASADWVSGVSEDLRELRKKVAQLEREREERKSRDDLQDRRLRVHERWDRSVADQLRDLGASVADPPPLYPDPTAA